MPQKAPMTDPQVQFNDLKSEDRWLAPGLSVIPNSVIQMQKLLTGKTLLEHNVSLIRTHYAPHFYRLGYGLLFSFLFVLYLQYEIKWRISRHKIIVWILFRLWFSIIVLTLWHSLGLIDLSKIFFFFLNIFVDSVILSLLNKEEESWVECRVRIWGTVTDSATHRVRPP